MKKWDKEIWVINILGAICLIAMFILFPTKSGEASQPIVREVEYHPYIHETINETVRQRELRELEPVVSQTTNYRLVATDEQKDLMARVVMSEASLLSFDGKCAVANTIVNRVLSDKFPSTIEEVIYPDICTSLRMSRRLLDMRFKEVKGVSPRDAIINRRLDALRKLLKSSDDAIAAICRKCGFGSENHPKKLFRQRFGMSMRDFRKSARRK